MIYSLFVINKAGGLVYQKDFQDMQRMHENEYLRQASTFHALFCMAQQLDPVQTASGETETGGIRSLKTSVFQLECLQTLTGTKFVLFAFPDTRVDLGQALQEVYRMYADHVLKNPFHTLENVIQSCRFTEFLVEYVQSVNSNKVQ